MTGMDVVSRDDGAGAAPLAEASRTAASDDARPWPSEAYGWYVAFVLVTVLSMLIAGF